ncbi:RNA polymerase-associated protein RapA [Paraneptunicella aestuarii]|uniref:RNA polymerase-associated protein RapA n=1 Tax=Paraneptunicella aestuarii TaxID=2831148 RepID=UPI001E40BFE7|nr:RNA polymerase-associated protein RapA [Paraneptunicella aestuarii]UAA38101.1 RNA polymerase-associated protein RapA [Paraneptunicella aestuarii]
MNQTAAFYPGQRWLSNAEMELGLGTVIAVTDRAINLLFPATGEGRNYAIKDAPLTRVAFSAGDTADHAEGWSFSIESVQEQNGMLTYFGVRSDSKEKVEVKETFLAHDFQLNAPEQRLFSGQFDNPKWFDIRKQCLLQQHAHLTSPLLGFVGARVELIQHQIHIAREVGQRFAPRVLLADEVGLGKTIEAALIIHQQLLTGRAQRVLIVVPSSLVHQWLVEMLRRVNLAFAIFDEERCDAASEDGGNPFESEQLILCSLDFLTENEKYFGLARDAGWDLLVVDEAHHLRWSPQEASQEYQVVQEIAANTKGVLLLTATPDQLGHESHFARLRLLDADRFHDYQRFIEEEQQYAELAQAIAPLLSILDSGTSHIDTLSLEHIKAIESFAGKQEWLSAPEQLKPDAINKLISELLDRHGTGRLLFRNSRNNIAGFPKRILNSYPLAMPATYKEAAESGKPDIHPEAGLRKRLAPEKAMLDAKEWHDEDPRVSWFIEKLQALQGKKVLTICAKSSTALALAEAVRLKSGIRTAVFHEHMTIVDRDKAANYFAQTEDGAQVLICSEIGSEGRNFQFAHHLVLFDLPLIPDLLEQRIGRLDRIGQTQDINLHVPYFEGSAQEVMLNWYHQSLNAFEHTCPTGGVIYEQVREELGNCLRQPQDSDATAQLIESTKHLHLDMLQKLEQGRDRLLELNSSGQGKIAPFIESIQDSDDSPYLEKFMSNLLDGLGVAQEERDEETYFLRPTESMISTLPGMDDEGMTVTYERKTATQLEHVHFLSWDHPLVNNAMDMLLAENNGKSSVCLFTDKTKPAGYFWLECLYVLTGHADKSLQLHRFLPPTPINISLDAKQTLITDEFQDLQSVKGKIGRQLCQALNKHITKTLESASQLAEKQANQIMHTQAEQVKQLLGDEINRLLSLSKINPSIREEEIQFLQTQYDGLLNAISSAKVRLEAVRLIVNNP